MALRLVREFGLARLPQRQFHVLDVRRTARSKDSLRQVDDQCASSRDWSLQNLQCTRHALSQQDGATFQIFIPSAAALVGTGQR